jgi:putative transposase
MSHTHNSALFHCIFGTKNRMRTIADEFRLDLWAYIGGIARNHRMKALAVGGTDDHLHTLLSLPATIPNSKAMQIIKASSSKWVHERFPRHRRFAWQEGYGAFSVHISLVDATIAYINTQEAHHRSKSFEEEYLAILRKHGIAYDENNPWD